MPAHGELDPSLPGNEMMSGLETAERGTSGAVSQVRLDQLVSSSVNGLVTFSSRHERSNYVLSFQYP